MSHISSLKHLIDLQLCRSSQAAVHATSHGAFTANDAEFCCPVTGLPFNGSARFMILPRNGFVVSEKALKQVRWRMVCAQVSGLRGVAVRCWTCCRLSPAGQRWALCMLRSHPLQFTAGACADGSCARCRLQRQ